MTERWGAIAGAPCYQVSDMGRVRRLAGYRCRTERMLRPRKDSDGYLLAHLSVSGHSFNAPVHQLVCEAFGGPKPSPWHQVGHKDGCRTNNASTNLRWVTISENANDRTRHGNSRSNVKLTAEQVKYVRSSPLNGVQLGRSLGVSSTQIYRIRKGESRVDVETLTKEARNAA